MAAARARVVPVLTAMALAVGGMLVAAPPATAVGDLVVTTASPGQYSESGTWATARAAGYDGTPERYSRVPGSTATWTAQVTAAATYEVAVFYANSVDNAQAQYAWTGGPSAPTVVDQTHGGGDWYTVGTAELTADEQFSLTVTAGAGAAVTTPDQNVITRANAVRLRPVAEVVVTTATSGRYAETGTWATARAAGFDGTPERYSRVPGSTATWTAQVPVAATYEVAVFYSGSVDNARVEYAWTGGPDTATVVDQAGNGGAWYTIGTAYLDEGQEFSLTLTAGDGPAVTTPGQTVISRANAVRIRQAGSGGPGPVTGSCDSDPVATTPVDAPRQDFGGYALEQSGTTVRVETSAWAMDVDRAGFRYSLSSGGVTRAAAHPVAGLQLAGPDGAVCDAVTSTVTAADATGVTASVVFAGGRTATVRLYPSEHSVRIAVTADDGRSGKIRAQVAGGLSPAYGLGDLGGFRQSLNVYGTKNLDYYAQNSSGTTNQRFVSNFTVFPGRELAQVSMSDERLAIQVDADATMLGVDGSAMDQMNYFFGDMPTIYAAYAQARHAAGYVDDKPEYQFFGVGYESYGALGYNTNQATITDSVSEYLERGYPLSWAVTGSGFWPYGSGSAQGTTSSFGLWGSKYPDPQAYKDFFASHGIALILGARQSFRALPSDGGTYDPALDGDGTLVGIERGYFIKDADGTPRVFTPVSFPNTAMYLIDPDNAEAVAWYADRMAEWGASGFKEDHMFDATANGFVDNSLVAPVNQALDGIGLMMVRNSAFSVAGSILRINDTDYNQGGSDRDRTVVNGLAYAASGQPNFYPDIVGGRIISDLETNTAKQRYLTRNAMMAAMSPSMSFGNEPWRMNDPELVAATLEAAQWHGRFQPYIYSAAVQSYETGYPATATPLPIAYPDDPATYSLVSYASKQYEWMLGPSLLVAPLYGSDATTATSRDVYLPAGEWMDIETGERFTGPTTLDDYPQPFGKIPAFVGGTGVVVQKGDDDGLLASVYPVAAPGSVYDFVAPDGETRSSVTTPTSAWSPQDAQVVDGAGRVVEHTVDPTTGAVTFALTPGVDYRVVDLAEEDGATAPPATGVLSDDNGWDTGLRDGDFTVSMDLWWGQNARTMRLYENGVLLDTVGLTMDTPSQQHVAVPVAGRPNGTYVYTAELVNSQGTTTTAPLTVVVRDASPGVPVLSDDDWDQDGRYTVSADLWWGTNATSWSLTENGVVVATGSLTAATPGAQHVAVDLQDRAPGDYEYVVTFANSLGATSSRPLTVHVRS